MLVKILKTRRGDFFCHLISQWIFATSLIFVSTWIYADEHGIVYTGAAPISVVTDVANGTGTISFDIAALPVLPATKIPAFDLHQPSTGVSCVVSLTGLYPSRSSVEPFYGEINFVGFNFAHRGWAFCNGQLLPIASNTALFSLFGTIYGGDGRTTFGLPDMRGRVPVHYGTGPGLRAWRIGEKYGSPTN